MGGSLPKDLIDAERTKLIPKSWIFLLKTFNFDSFRIMEQDEDWEKVTVTLFQAKLDLKSQKSHETYLINHDFLIINQNHRSREFIIALMREKKIWKIQAQSIRQFLDFSTVLTHSKVPSWSISPVCQICSKEFSLTTRNHHCRNCGKNICKDCKVTGNYRIEGFYKLKTVCKDCEKLIESQIEVIQGLQRNEIFWESTRDQMLPCPSGT